MSKRGSPALQVFVVIGVVAAFLYGFYSYHDQHTRLKRSEESGDKLKQKTESLSAQLQGNVCIQQQWLPYRRGGTVDDEATVPSMI